MKRLFREIKYYSIVMFASFLGFVFFSLCCSGRASATKNILSNSMCQFGVLSESDLYEFSQNDILFYDPSDCISSNSSLVATGDYAAVMQAKNADKWFFNGEGNIRNGGWGTDKESMKSILEAYGDLAYQTGRAAGIPWIAILAQMPWEDPDSVCGHNNFWGNGCNSTHAYVGGADEVIGEAKNLGEGFIKYAETVHNGLYEEALTKTDPLEYIRALEGTWIGTGVSYNIEGHINAMTEYIQTPEGEAIVKTFGSYSGSSLSSSSSSSSSSSNSDAEITLIGDSISVMAEQELKSKFPSGYFTMVGSRNPTSGGVCAGDKGGLEILQELVGGAGTILTQQHDKSSCDSLEIDSNSLNGNVVWELGTNTIGATKETMEEVVNLVGNGRKLFLVTPYNGDSRYKASTEAIANMYREIAEEYDNVYIVDWANVVKDSENTYIYTESYAAVHPTDEGKELLAKLIAEAVSGSDGCTTYDGEYPEYLQGDPKWGSMPYGSGTMANSGCGAASMAMLATVAAGKDIFPNDIADFLGDQYYYNTSVHVLDPKVGEHYGFEVKTDDSSSEEETKTKFREYLKNGYMIHYTGHGCYPGFQSGDYCSPGHVIGIFSIDKDDNVMLADSAFGGNQKISLDTVAKTKLWSAFTAIKGGNTSKNNCGSNLCNDSGNSINFGSLTEEQAQKIADYYNSDEVTASNFIGGEIPSIYDKVNCVSFSYWFVSAFTDASDKGATTALIGDGSYIADTGLPNILGWENGNDPTPYSIFGGAGSEPWSHTGVVVGTTDSGDILTIEAAYGQYDARVMTKPRSYFAEGVGILAYPGEHFTPNESHLGNKSFNEIIGN